MAENKSSSSSVKVREAHELVMAYQFNAPRALIWKMWEKPEHLMRWWVPRGFGIKVVAMDFSRGGMFHYGLRSLDGQYVWGKFSYIEIAPQERIVFINTSTDEEGRLIRNPLSPTWPMEVLNTLTLSEDEGKTALILKQSPRGAAEVEIQTFDETQPAARLAYNEVFKQLANYLTTL